MKRLAQRLALVAALVAGLMPLAMLAQGSAHIAIKGVRNFSAETYNADRQNWAVVQDNRGIFYFGNNSGVLEFDGARWRLIGLPGGRGAYSLAKSSDGQILVGSEGEMGGLVPDQAGSMVYVSKADDLPESFRTSGDRVIRIFDTPVGRVFLSDHWLFVRTEAGTLTSVPSADHFLQAAWFKGALYVLDSARGLTRLDGGALKNVPGGANMRGLAMVVTEAGLLIPTYSDGLVRYAPDSGNPWQVLNAQGWSAVGGEEVTSAVALNSNLFALGTAKHGVMLIDAAGTVLEQIGPGEGLADDHVYNIYYDHDGGLWLAVDNGVWLVSLDLPKDGDAVPFRAFVRSFTGTQDEHLLFGGAFFATPGGVPQLVQGVGQKLKFRFNYNAFRIAYAANGVDASGDMQYQTYVQGVDKDWTAWSMRSDREFTQLAPGTWVFRVRARRVDGQVSAEGSYQWQITPAWYNTWWFLVFQVVFVIAILVLPSHAPHPRMQEVLTTFAVIVPFVYIGNWLGDLVNHYYSTDIAFIQVLISGFLSLALDPLQSGLKSRIEKRSEKVREMREKLAAEVEHIEEEVVEDVERIEEAIVEGATQLEKAVVAEGHHLADELEQMERAVVEEGRHLVEGVEHMFGDHHHDEGAEKAEPGHRSGDKENKE